MLHNVNFGLNVRIACYPVIYKHIYEHDS